MKTKPQSDKQVISILCDAQYDFIPHKLRKLLSENIHPDALCRYFHPIGDVKTDLLYDKVYIPLHLALPDLRGAILSVLPALMMMGFPGLGPLATLSALSSKPL